MPDDKKIFAPDLTKRPPRSPRLRLGGYALLPRMLDKGRAEIAGTNGEYHFNCPLDQRILDFIGIDANALREQLATGGGDGEILHCNHHSAKPTTLKPRVGNASQVRSIGAEIVSNRYKSGIDDDFLTTLHKRPPCMIFEPSLISISSDFSSFKKLRDRTLDNIV